MAELPEGVEARPTCEEIYRHDEHIGRIVICFCPGVEPDRWHYLHRRGAKPDRQYPAHMSHDEAIAALLDAHRGQGGES